MKTVKGWLYGDKDALMALVNALNASGQLLRVSNSRFHPGTKGSMRFEITLEPATHFEPVYERPARDKSGWVYLIKTPENGVYKIGCTKDPTNRMRTFGSLLPFEVDYVHLIETDDMRALEKGLHKRFARQRIGHSEFFTLTDRQKEYFCSL